jgi:hypothetical protein
MKIENYKNYYKSYARGKNNPSKWTTAIEKIKENRYNEDNKLVKNDQETLVRFKNKKQTKTNWRQIFIIINFIIQCQNLANVKEQKFECRLIQETKNSNQESVIKRLEQKNEQTIKRDKK